MSAKASATAAWDWKDPEAADQAPGPHPISAPTHVPPSPPHDPHMLPLKGFKKPWKGKVGKEKEIELPEEAYEKDAETPTEYWWAHLDGMWLQMKPVRTPVAILGSLGVCIYVPASRHWLISYSPVHLN